MIALLRTIGFALIGAPAIALSDSLLVRLGLKRRRATGRPVWR